VQKGVTSHITSIIDAYTAVGTTVTITQTSISTPSTTPSITPPSSTTSTSSVPTSIVNGGFEDGTTNGWTLTDPNPGRASCNMTVTDAANAYDGSYAGLIQSTYSDYPEGECTISQDVQFTAATSYNCSAWVSVSPSGLTCNIYPFLNGAYQSQLYESGPGYRLSSFVFQATGVSTIAWAFECDQPGGTAPSTLSFFIDDASCVPATS
jgi:hypothetical protein